MLAKLEDLLGAISGVAVVAMMLLVTLDAAFRYWIGSPISGAAEFTEMYLMVGIVYLTLSRTARLDGHVRVTVLRDLMRPWMRRVVDVVCLSLVLVVLVVITDASLDHAQLRWGGVLGGSTALPTGPSYALVPIGTGLMCVRVLVQIIGVLVGRSPFPESGRSAQRLPDGGA